MIKRFNSIFKILSSCKAPINDISSSTIKVSITHVGFFIIFKDIKGNTVFPVSLTTLNKTYNIKIKVSKMETPNNNPVYDKEANISINVKGKEANTQFVGEIENEKLPNTGLGFLLGDKFDILDGSDLKSLYENSVIKKDGLEIEENTKLVTGDIINIDGANYTVIIYGDASGDGKISILDTSTIISSIRGKNELNEAQKIALDVTRDSKISILDSTKLINVIRGEIEYLSLLK